MVMQYEEKEVLNKNMGYGLSKQNVAIGDELYGEFLEGKNYVNQKFNKDGSNKESTASMFLLTREFVNRDGSLTLKEGSQINIHGTVMGSLFNSGLLVPGKHYKITRVEPPAGKDYVNWKVVSLAIVGEKDDLDASWG